MTLGWGRGLNIVNAQRLLAILPVTITRTARRSSIQPWCEWRRIGICVTRWWMGRGILDPPTAIRRRRCDTPRRGYLRARRNYRRVQERARAIDVARED